jgi:hypothetical protein
MDCEEIARELGMNVAPGNPPPSDPSCAVCGKPAPSEKRVVQLCSCFPLGERGCGARAHPPCLPVPPGRKLFASAASPSGKTYFFDVVALTSVWSLPADGVLLDTFKWRSPRCPFSLENSPPVPEMTQESAAMIHAEVVAEGSERQEATDSADVDMAVDSSPSAARHRQAGPTEDTPEDAPRVARRQFPLVEGHVQKTRLQKTGPTESGTRDGSPTQLESIRSADAIEARSCWDSAPPRTRHPPSIQLAVALAVIGLREKARREAQDRSGRSETRHSEPVTPGMIPASSSITSEVSAPPLLNAIQPSENLELGDPVARSWRLRLTALSCGIDRRLEDISKARSRTASDESLRQAAGQILNPVLAMTRELLSEFFSRISTEQNPLLLAMLGRHEAFAQVFRLLSTGVGLDLPTAISCAANASMRAFQLICDREQGHGDAEASCDVYSFLRGLAIIPPVAFNVLLMATRALRRQCEIMLSCIEDALLAPGVPEEAKDAPGCQGLIVSASAPQLVESSLANCLLIEHILEKQFPPPSGTVVDPNRVLASTRDASRKFRTVVGEDQFHLWATEYDQIFSMGESVFSLPQVLVHQLLFIAAFIV